MRQDPYKYFRIEVRDIVDQMGKNVLELEKGPLEPERVARLLRLAHTLKGAARVVKQREIAEIAHAMEDALGPLRTPGAAVTRNLVESLLGMLDSLQLRSAALAPAPEARPEAPSGAAQVEPLRTVRADVADMDALLDGLAEVGIELAALRQCSRGLQGVRHLADLLSDQVVARTTGVRGTDPHEVRATAEDLRLAIGALDRDLSLAVEQTDRELRQARELAERLRLVPAGLMFYALERAARDAAASLDKRVVVETKGGDVRVDADVLASIQGALVHAVRNAVAHGIEGSVPRNAAGKPEAGRLSLEVARRGGKVAFVCRDDGRGIDVAAVARAAKRAGKLLEGQAPSESDLVRLLLGGGISTSTSVTDVSGRGVGLDAVRETAARLGGDVSLRSDPGRGTELEILVPVSLASLDALLVESAGAVAAVPLDCVRATLRLAPSDVARTAEGESILWGGNVIPFAPLARSLATAAAREAPSRARAAMVVESGGTLAAIGVDRLIGTENVVLRALSREVHARAVIGGASLDARGTPQPVLDPAALVASVRGSRVPERPAPPPPHAILVVDDSLTTRMLEQSILESAGYEVDLATSGEEALAKAVRRRYGLFLVDVEMPGMDGFTFVERTRAHPDLGRVPAILVTSRGAAEDRRRGEAAGASAYIVKSEFDQNDLLRRIRELVG